MPLTPKFYQAEYIYPAVPTQASVLTTLFASGATTTVIDDVAIGDFTTGHDWEPTIPIVAGGTNALTQRKDLAGAIGYDFGTAVSINGVSASDIKQRTSGTLTPTGTSQTQQTTLTSIARLYYSNDGTTWTLVSSPVVIIYYVGIDGVTGFSESFTYGPPVVSIASPYREFYSGLLPFTTVSARYWGLIYYVSAISINNGASPGSGSLPAQTWKLSMTDLRLFTDGALRTPDMPIAVSTVEQQCAFPQNEVTRACTFPQTTISKGY